MPLKRRTVATGNCRATTKAGHGCAAPVVRGGIYCALHADPERAAELGRKGGARNRKVYIDGEQEVSVPTSLGEVKKLLAETMAGVRSGTINPLIGRTVACLAAPLLRAYEADPPVPLEPAARPTIYRALQYRTSRNAEIAEAMQQKELQAPSLASAPAIPTPTANVEVAPRKQEEMFEILDYEPRASEILGAEAARRVSRSGE